MMITRFAPSPTGHLHIGGARTALFSWLMARHSQGRFLLRIEDTDQARSDQTMTQGILDSLNWLNLNWDGQIVYQSERAGVHRACVDRLLDSGQAYWCACSPELLDEMREEAMKNGLKPKYDGRCRDLGLGLAPGRVVRLRAPLTGRIDFVDMVKGPVSVSLAELDDMILLRGDGTPTYNLAVVADDADMGVTHVLRGDDHLSNTPKQILLYRALGYVVPEFGHVPLIHGQDKHKLSKRHGARSVMEYRQDGYLPEALLNYLVRLGWSHGDQEIFSQQDMVDYFTPEHLNKSAAAFDPEKLLWLNATYIKQADPARLAGLLLEQPVLDGLSADIEYLKKIVPLYQERAKTMKEMAEAIGFFFYVDDRVEYDPAAKAKFFTPESLGHLQALGDELSEQNDFSRAGLESFFNAYFEKHGLAFKTLAQPIRVALTGKTASPGLFETMEVLGRPRTVARLLAAARSGDLRSGELA